MTRGAREGRLVGSCRFPKFTIITGSYVQLRSYIRRRGRANRVSRRYRRGHQASPAPGGLPAAGTLPSSPFRRYNGGSAKRCWPSVPAELEALSTAITSGSSVADCSPPPPATPSECRPPNQVRISIITIGDSSISRF